MAQLSEAFNPNEIDPKQSGGGGLPIGKHKVHIIESEVKATSNSDGGMLVLKLQVVEGQYQGVTGNYNLNIYCVKSERAMSIAKQQLSAVCHAVGYLQPVTDTSVLHGKPFIVEAGPQKDKPQYTEVKRVMDIHGNEPTKGATPAPAAQPAAPAQQSAPAPAQPAVAPSAPAQAAWNQPAAPAAPAPATQPAAQPAWGAPAQPANDTAPAAPAAPQWQQQTAPPSPAAGQWG